MSTSNPSGKKEEMADKKKTDATHSSNQVESNEIFTATQRDTKPVVPLEIEKKYLRVGNKFYHPQNTSHAAFEDKGNKLETKSNNETVAASMVRIAQARGWDEIKVSGSETFRREIWIEAAARGMQVKGYFPTEMDKAAMSKRMRQVDVPAPNAHRAEAFKTAPEEAAKRHPELAGAVAVVAAIEKKIQSDGLTSQQRAIVMARVRENIANSIERGNIPNIKIREHIQMTRNAQEEKELSR